MIKFEKWHGNGNDFVIINSIEQKIKLKKSFIKDIADRNKGVGFDQLIHVCLPTKDNKDFFVRFYNSDGSEAGMCLNGIRCSSKYLWKNSFAPSIMLTSFKR
jgi:diaminopimelate epimerase